VIRINICWSSSCSWHLQVTLQPSVGHMHLLSISHWESSSTGQLLACYASRGQRLQQNSLDCKFVLYSSAACLFRTKQQPYNSFLSFERLQVYQKRSQDENLESDIKLLICFSAVMNLTVGFCCFFPFMTQWW
jgi:hypothetical protein